MWKVTTFWGEIISPCPWQPGRGCIPECIPEDDKIRLDRACYNVGKLSFFGVKLYHPAPGNLLGRTKPIQNLQMEVNK